MIVMIGKQQLAMVQIGIMMSKYFPDDLPSELDEVKNVAFEELGVEIKKGDDIEKVRDKLRDALDAVKEL